MGKTPVALVRCDEYEDDKVYEALKRGIDLLGGIGQFLSPGERLLLKPNVLVGDLPEKGSTTHPVVFKATGRLFQEAGAGLSYGDSPGFGPVKLQMQRCGLHAPAEELGIPLADFDKGRKVSPPGAPYPKPLFLANGPLEADGIINICKMKAHVFQRITGGVKNLFGCIPGVVKAEYHLKLPGTYEFARMLCSIHFALKPRLHIMDGVYAMEGNGPRSGDMVPMRCLLISRDPVAMDATAARLMNLDPALVPAVTEGVDCGLGVMNEEEIELKGDSLDSFINKEFKVQRGPVESFHSHKGYVSLLNNLLATRPKINKNLCVRCGICINVCPLKPEVLNWKKGNKKNPPVYDYRKCIRCFCCQELCPEKAIAATRPWLGKLLVKE